MICFILERRGRREVKIMEMVAALIQSTAVSMLTIGFVSAGLLPFRQSIGLIMGAKRAALTQVLFNLGTAILAVLLAPLLLWATRGLSMALFDTFDAAVGIAIFHTYNNSFFNKALGKSIELERESDIPISSQFVPVRCNYRH